MGDLFKDLVFDKLIDLALNKLFASIPALGWGPIGWLVSYAVKKFATILYEEMGMHLAIQNIAFRNTVFEKEFRDASVRLKLVSRLGVDSEEYKEALREAQNSMDNVIKFEPARSA